MGVPRGLHLVGGMAWDGVVGDTCGPRGQQEMASGEGAGTGRPRSAHGHKESQAEPAAEGRNVFQAQSSI